MKFLFIWGKGSLFIEENYEIRNIFKIDGLQHNTDEYTYFLILNFGRKLLWLARESRYQTQKKVKTTIKNTKIC